MANTINAVTPISRRTHWRQVIAWIPLALVALRLLASVLEPGQSFFDGQTSGIYLLFEYEGYIAVILTLGIMAAAVLALVDFSRARIQRQPFRPLDASLAVLNALILATVCYLTFMVMTDYWPMVTHRDTRSVSGHIYHLAEVKCFSGAACGPANFLENRYAVIDCGALGIVCQEVYLSDPIGLANGDPLPQSHVIPSAAFSDGPSGRLQLVDGETVLWTSP